MSSLINERAAQMATVQKEGLELFKKKNADYGDSFAIYGPVGVIIRVGDKINRLSSVTQNGVNLVDTESIRDTLIDLHNYAAMAIILLDNKDKASNPYIVNFIEKSNLSINPLNRRLHTKHKSFREKCNLKIDIPSKINAFKFSGSKI